MQKEASGACGDGNDGNDWKHNAGFGYGNVSASSAIDVGNATVCRGDYNSFMEKQNSNYQIPSSHAYINILNAGNIDNRDYFDENSHIDDSCNNSTRCGNSDDDIDDSSDDNNKVITNKKRRHYLSFPDKHRVDIDVCHGSTKTAKKKRKRKRYLNKYISKSSYTTTKEARLQDINNITSQLSTCMSNDIMYSCHHSNRKTHRYDPVPLLILSGAYINHYVGFDNCIILKDPRVKFGTKFEIIHSKKPSHIGKNIDHTILYQYERGISLKKIPGKKILLLTPRKSLIKTLGNLNIKFIEIKIPDYSCKNPQKRFDKDYMMIMFACNEDDHKINDNC